MPAPLTVSLLVAIAALVAARIVVPGLPPVRLAGPLRAPDALLVTVGTLGLLAHCLAMFYPAVVAAVPGSGPYARLVNAMGPGSVVLFAVPAAILIVGLRHHRAVGVVVLVLTLVAVGVTMYDGGPLTAHLIAISAAVIVIAVLVVVLTTWGAARSASGSRG
jgi:hypothetical protein